MESLFLLSKCHNSGLISTLMFFVEKTLPALCIPKMQDMKVHQFLTFLSSNKFNSLAIPSAHMAALHASKGYWLLFLFTHTCQKAWTFVLAEHFWMSASPVSWCWLGHSCGTSHLCLLNHRKKSKQNDCLICHPSIHQSLVKSGMLMQMHRAL